MISRFIFSFFFYLYLLIIVLGYQEFDWWQLLLVSGFCFSTFLLPIKQSIKNGLFYSLVMLISLWFGFFSFMAFFDVINVWDIHNESYLLIALAAYILLEGMLMASAIHMWRKGIESKKAGYMAVVFFAIALLKLLGYSSLNSWIYKYIH